MPAADHRAPEAHACASGTAYSIELAMASGRRVTLSSLRLDPRTGSAGQSIPVDLHRVSSVRLVGVRGGDVLDARFPHTPAGNPG
jgi:hypothetical protein